MPMSWRIAMILKTAVQPSKRLAVSKQLRGLGVLVNL
jgi:hypothetical protein